MSSVDVTASTVRVNCPRYRFLWVVVEVALRVGNRRVKQSYQRVGALPTFVVVCIVDVVVG